MTYLTVLIAGCGAEVVHVRGGGLSPDGPFAPPAGHVATQPTAQPSASPNGVIHFITGGGGPTTPTVASNGAQPPFPAPVLPDSSLCRGTSVAFPGDLMLTPGDVWADAPNNAQAGMAIDFPIACAFDQPAVPVFDCTIGFPWYTATQTSVALANIGVVQFDMDTLIHGQQEVTEYLLHLGGNAATDLTHMASACDPPQSDQDAANDIFRATTNHGVTTSLLRISGNLAVALVFHGFPEGTKDFLFALASTRAGQS